MKRGRDLEQILTQYTTFVKPAFEEFCLPVLNISLISFAFFFWQGERRCRAAWGSAALYIQQRWLLIFVFHKSHALPPASSL